MCGRYALKHSLAEICAAFGANTALAGFGPDFNAAPESARPIVIRDRVGMGQWGWPMVAGLSPVINIRHETMGEKPMFAPSVRAGRRCVAPASGFFEWDSSGQPFFVESADAPLMALCGLWVREPDHSVRFALLTQGAGPDLAPIHPRMPLAATPDDARKWLMDGVIPPMPGMRAYPVSRAVNDVANNSADLLTETVAPQGNLFAAG